jgi:Leucine-rich repeat (LRR) protein
MCQLTINNPNGYNSFTGITGTHQPGFGDADVELVQIVSGSTSIVPRIICTKFPNTGYLSLYGGGITSIGDTAFSGCTHVKDISLQMNRISSISANAFVNNREVESIGLSQNSLATLPENVFASQQNLLELNMGNNPFQNIPAGLFRPLENVLTINLDVTRITAINNQWFAQNSNLDYLSLVGNTIVVNPNSFVGMSGLNGLNLNDNGITDIPSGTFTPLVNLEYLSLSKNRVTQIRANSLPASLVQLDLSGNPLGTIPDGTFQDLVNLYELDLTFTALTSLSSNSFRGLARLGHITLNTNQIQDLPAGLFASSPELETLYILNNGLTAVRRRTFASSVANVVALAFEGNSVRAIDRSLIDDAVNLNYLYMNGNQCANFFFHTFVTNRPQYMPMLQTCFNNAV